MIRILKSYISVINSPGFRPKAEAAEAQQQLQSPPIAQDGKLEELGGAHRPPLVEHERYFRQQQVEHFPRNSSYCD